MAIKTRQTTATGVTNNNAPLTNAELDNNFVELQQNKVDASGDTMTGNLSFGDSDKAIFGDDSDLQIYHGGGNSFIEDKGAGNLYIDGSSSVVIRGETANTISAVFNDNGAVNLRYGGDIKLATSSTGVDVTGEVKADKFTNDEALPDVRPSLLLDFANSKTLDPRITFTRGSTATYWDGKTTTKAEENLVLGSDDLGVNNGGWSASNLTRTAASIAAPDGTTTAAELNVDTTSNTFHFIGSTGSGQPTTVGTVTFSVFCKANDVGYAYMCVRTDGGSNRRAVAYDLSGSGAIADIFDQGSPIGGAQTITSVGNGWYRCTLTLTNTSGTVLPFVGPHNDDSLADINGSYGGVVGEGIYAWGAQLEYRNSATAYTATTSSPIAKYQPVLQTAASGEARFDHDPVTGESKGLLIEEARTNTINESENAPFQFSNIYSQPFLENTAIAPDGTQTADAVYGARIDTSSRLERGFNYASGTKLTLSFFQKTMSGSHNSNGSPVWAFQNSLGITADTVVTEPVGNGWYRMHYVMTTTAASQTLRLYYSSAVAQEDVVAVWGYQLEVGAFPTSYIPTSGSTVTRSTDSAFIQGISDWYSHTVGSTVYFEANNLHDYPTGNNFRTLEFFTSTTSSTGIVSVLNNVGTDYIEAGANYGTVWTLGLMQRTKPAQNTDYKGAFAWSSTEGAFVVGDQAVATDTGYLLDPPTYLGIGRNYNNSSPINGTIKKLSYYPKRLPNATLQAMTEE
jgi:hypothetical protein